jgi:ribonuclease HII
MARPEPRPSAFPGLLAHDLETGARLVGGADESGRAALAGPLVAAACVFDWAAVSLADRARLVWLDDCKDVTAPRLRFLREVILELAVSVSVAVITVEEVDREEVHPANLRALRDAVDGLDPAPDVCFIDHYAVAGCRYTTTALERGDATSAAVAAASVISKTTHDALMEPIAAECHGFGFTTNQGYTSPAHRDALRRLGLTPYHRRSIYPKIYRELGLPRPPKRHRRGPRIEPAGESDARYAAQSDNLGSDPGATPPGRAQSTRERPPASVGTRPVQHTVDLDEEALLEAQARLGTKTTSETVNAALRHVAAQRGGRVERPA